MTPLKALSLSFETVSQMLVAGPITQADLERDTPCSAYTVAELADHIRDTHLFLTNAATGEQAQNDSPLADCHADLADAAVKAWTIRGEDGDVDLGGNALPASFALSLHVIETFVHGWDLARALGRRFAPSAELSAFVWGIAPEVISDGMRGDQEGAPYRAAVPLPGAVSGATKDLTSLIAFTGRDPQWRSTTA